MPKAWVAEMDAEAVEYLSQVSRRLSPQGLTSVVAERLLHSDPDGAIVGLAQQTPNNLVIRAVAESQ
jgi:hypothetical protein